MSDEQTAANELAAGVASFLQALPFMAPECIAQQAWLRMGAQLAEYREAAGSDDDVDRCGRCGADLTSTVHYDAHQWHGGCPG